MNATPTEKKPYPFGWPTTGKPSRDNRQPERKWKRKRASLTASEAMAQNGRAVSDASEAGRENPTNPRRTKRQNRALFLCPESPYGDGCGAGFGLAGSLGRFLTPASVATITGVRTGVATPTNTQGVTR